VEDRAEVCAALNIVIESLNDKYLGLPAMIGIDRSDCFRHLIDRVRGKTKGWKEKLLSMGGKEVLIKSVTQAVAVFTMMVFKIPKNICKGIMMSFRNSGGATTMITKGFIGRLGGSFVYQRREAGWDSEI
jgi:hypothetical protein